MKKQERGLSLLLNSPESASIFVARERGKAIGSQLVLQAIEYARARGITRITLLTDIDNQRAMRFYERHAFVASAMRPIRLHF